MDQEEQIQNRIHFIKQITPAAELSYVRYRINSEPARIGFKVCTFDGEVYQASVYVSWLLRVSLDEIAEFAHEYLS
jgi:hypothetical protein